DGVDPVAQILVGHFCCSSPSPAFLDCELADYATVGWAKAARVLVECTASIRRAHALAAPRGHGGACGVPSWHRLGRLCPPYGTAASARRFAAIRTAARISG